MRSSAAIFDLPLQSSGDGDPTLERAGADPHPPALRFLLRSGA
jgi:hypothetical protein